MKEFVLLVFVKKKQKWYDWSHRAIAGFGVGSKVKIDDCGFNPRNIDEFIEKEIIFWTEDHKNVTVKKINNKEVCVEWTYSDNIPNKELRLKHHSHIRFIPRKWGNGKWTAKTLEDAKQMAIDFAKDVS